MPTAARGFRWAVHGSWAALAWVAGIAVQLQQAALSPALLYVAAGLASLLWLAVGPSWRGRSWLLALQLGALAGLSWAVAGLHACAVWAPMDAALEGRDLDVVGRVQAMAQRQDVGWRFRFVVEQASWQGQAVQVPEQVYLGWYGASARDAQALDDTLRAPPVQPGERWRFRVRLKAPHGHLNPRGFDYELWLWEQGIRATGYVRQGRHDPAPQRLEQTWWHPVEWARQQVRERLLARLAEGSPGSSGQNVAGILAALVTGDQAAIEREDWDVFRASGVAHLMSISGVHVTLLGWLVAAVAVRVWRRTALWGEGFMAWGVLRWPAPLVGRVVGLAVASLYALFSGWGVPAQRTVWMLAVVTVLRWSGRDWPWRHVWAAAAVVVLTLDPWALWQPGFWLSFVAVGVLMATDQGKQPSQGLMLVQRTDVGMPCTAMVRPWWRLGLAQATAWGGQLLREQALISLALLPLSVLFFGQFSLVGLLANLVAIPWITLWVTPLALLGGVWAGAWDLAAWSLQPLVVVLAHLASWRWASVSLAMPPWPLAVLALAGAVALVLHGPLAWRVLGLPLLVPALLWQAPRPQPGQFELLAADVGQGNAVLVRTAGHTLLYDAGPRYSPESDAGHRVLVPLLAQMGERLDVLVLSHRDQDHIGGANAVLAMQPQAALLSSLTREQALVGQALAQGRAVRPCAAGQSWVWDGVRFAVLHPLPDAPQRPSNARSCVLRIQAGSVSALLAGDIEAAQERELLARGLAPVDVLLAPHHGSKTSSTEAFVRALQPRQAWVQAGYRNRFGHPAAEVVARYRALGVPLVDSAHCGAMHWHSEAPQAVRCERESARRYWHHAVHP